MKMQFIDIERRTPQGREYGEPDASSLAIHEQSGNLIVVAGLPHGSLIRPCTPADRDVLVAHLQSLDYNEG